MGDFGKLFPDCGYWKHYNPDCVTRRKCQWMDGVSHQQQQQVLCHENYPRRFNIITHWDVCFGVLKIIRMICDYSSDWLNPLMLPVMDSDWRVGGFLFPMDSWILKTKDRIGLYFSADWSLIPILMWLRSKELFHLFDFAILTIQLIMISSEGMCTLLLWRVLSLNAIISNVSSCGPVVSSLRFPVELSVTVQMDCLSGGPKSPLSQSHSQSPNYP